MLLPPQSWPSHLPALPNDQSDGMLLRDLARCDLSEQLRQVLPRSSRCMRIPGQLHWLGGTAHALGYSSFCELALELAHLMTARLLSRGRAKIRQSRGVPLQAAQGRCGSGTRTANTRKT